MCNEFVWLLSCNRFLLMCLHVFMKNSGWCIYLFAWNVIVTCFFTIEFDLFQCVAREFLIIYTYVMGIWSIYMLLVRFVVFLHVFLWNFMYVHVLHEWFICMLPWERSAYMLEMQNNYCISIYFAMEFLLYTCFSRMSYLYMFS